MGYFDNHFLFSETYIKEYINQVNRKKTEVNDDIESAFKQVKEWNNEYVFGDYSNEHWFGYIDSVLDVLKFPGRKTVGNTRVLYANTINESARPVAVCHFVEKEEDIASTRKGKYYAYDAIRTAKEHDVNWAMLTNGYQWRIYNTKNVSPYENYLEIDIEESIKNNTKADDAFKLFNLFFNVHTYYTEDGELEIEKIKDLSDTKAETIEEALRGKAEEILKELCYGLIENINKEIYTEKEKKDIYNDAIILLYRLLFFGYAESRGLLPIVENDPEYTDSYKKLCDDAKDIHDAGEVYKLKDGFEFWERLDNHIRYYVDRSYNGGLFHNEDKPILKEHRIANGRLTKCLVELSYNTDKIGKYTETIEYKDLSVRNLGSIYEGLLEYQLFIAEERMVQRKTKGQVKYLKAADIKLQNSDLKSIIEKGGIYLSQDALERKETGAYYTPEDVVEYIAENTVGKKLKELKEGLADQKRSLLEQISYEPLESRKRMMQNQIDEITMNFINDKILSLSIIDSAMGSGHFLVNAAYRVANEIVEIICENAWESEDIIADIRHWKRKVVENCIYGIDINGLSVALARLSLWLISASNDKALSFIDHHLKVGNSIIGTDRKHVEVKDSKYPMFGVSYDDYMKPVLIKYQELMNIGSATKADVSKQKEIYDKINEDLRIAKKKYDYYLASQYAGGIYDQITYINLLRSNDIRDFQEEYMESLWIIASERQFFHWELEFPEVFQKGGFDIAIGNPPYVELKDCKYKPSVECIGNLYTSFIIQSFSKTVKSSSFGFIIPMSSICTDRTESFQKILLEHSEQLKIANFSWRPGKIFSGVNLQVSILIGIQKGSLSESRTKVLTTRYNIWNPNERKELFSRLNYVDGSNYIWRGSIPKIGESVEIDILKKLFEVKKTFKSFLDKDTSNLFYYRRGGLYFKIFTNFVTGSSEEKILEVKKDLDINVAVAIFNSSTWFWFFTLFSDCRHLGRREIDNFPIDFETMDRVIYTKLSKLGNELNEDLKKNSKIKMRVYKDVKEVECYQFYAKNSIRLIDKIDDLIGNYYRFSVEEIKFIKDYNRSFRIYDEDIEE